MQRGAGRRGWAGRLTVEAGSDPETGPADQQGSAAPRGGRPGGRGRGRGCSPQGRGQASRGRSSRGRGDFARHREPDPAGLRHGPEVQAAVAAALSSRPDAASAVQLPEVQLAPAGLPDQELSGDAECLVCCSSLQEAQAVAVGRCNHKEVCARCCIRMRLCYADCTCPLCKTELPEVAIACWRADATPDWPHFEAHRARLWANPRWARGVLVEPLQVDPGHAGFSRPLHKALQGMTGFCCSVCDPQGLRSFPSSKALQHHTRTAHQLTLCTTCLEAKRLFPGELEARGPSEHKAHAATHPSCKFCSLSFYDADALFEHNRSQHFWCALCAQQHRELCFRLGEHLTEHLSQEHFVCTEPQCMLSFVAFSSPQGLASHMHREHSIMPGRARPEARIQQQMASMLYGNAPRESRRARERAQEATAYGDYVQRSTGDSGLTMIDDNPNFPDLPGAAVRQPAAPAQRPDPFPALMANGSLSAAEAPDAQQRSQRAARGPEPLERITVRCDCGRQVLSVAGRPGQQVRPPKCDAECRRIQRQSRLADAFGVDPSTAYVPVVDRTRTAHYPTELLTFAYHNRQAVLEAERHLNSFLADASSRRLSLPPGSSDQRRLLHQIATHYGLATQSFGSEPRRHIDLFKSAAAAMPDPLLSQAAERMTLEDLEALERAAKAYVLQLADVTPQANLQYHFARWEGHFQTEGPRPDGTATVRFQRSDHLKEALDYFGGGLRGLFRLVHIRPPSKGRTGAEPAGSAQEPKQRAGSPTRPVPHAGPKPQGPDYAANQFARLALEQAWENG